MASALAPSPGRRPRIAITCGEPAGIGPEISIRAAWALRETVDAVLIGDDLSPATLAAYRELQASFDRHDH